MDLFYIAYKDILNMLKMDYPELNANDVCITKMTEACKGDDKVEGGK